MLVLADLSLAQDAGVLSAQEVFALEVLAESDDDTVPESLLDAVERLWLWFCETSDTQH
jgi:hypothetical protein